MIKISGEIKTDMESDNKTLYVVANILTSMDGEAWTPNIIRTNGFSYNGVDPREITMKELLNLFEILRILGFTKTQIINAIPIDIRPDFRREFAKIKHDGVRRTWD